MTCNDHEIRMHEELDGELPPALRALLDAHCAACPECARMRDDLRALRDAARALPTTIEPPAELWDRINAVLPDSPGSVVPLRPKGFWNTARPYLAAACVAGAVLAAALLRGMPPDGVATPPGDGPLALVESLEAEYGAARAEFLQALEAREAALPGDTLATVRENLAVIDGAVEEIRLALDADPANLGLMELLVAARGRELALYAAVLDLPGAG